MKKKKKKGALVTREQGGWAVVEEGKEAQTHGDGRRLDFGW